MCEFLLEGGSALMKYWFFQGVYEFGKFRRSTMRVLKLGRMSPELRRRSCILALYWKNILSIVL